MYCKCAIRNHSQIVIIHKARILRKMPLEKTFLEFKEWIKIYNAASMVIVSKYFLNGNPIWQTLSMKSFFFQIWTIFVIWRSHICQCAPDSTPRNDLYCYIAEGRGYYSHTVAEGEAGSWSDVEEERERQAFVNC